MKKTVSAIAALFMTLGLFVLVAPPATSNEVASGVSQAVMYKSHHHHHNHHRKHNRKHQKARSPVIKPVPRISPKTHHTAAVQPHRHVTHRQQPRQVSLLCVIIEQPTKTKVVYKTRTKTKTEKVLYGAGVISLAAVIVGLLTLFLGFILGWRNARDDEKKFYKSVLHRD